MKKILNITLVLMTLAFTSTVFAEILEDIRIECKDADGKKVCKPIKVGDPVDEGFKLMKGIRVDKTIVDGKAVFKTININKSASQDEILTFDTNALHYLGEHCACKSQCH
jgi:hypothetical protein